MIYSKNDWSMFLAAFVILALFSLCGFAAYSSIKEQAEKIEKMGCEYYASFRMKDVPAKCINYFSNKN